MDAPTPATSAGPDAVASTPPAAVIAPTPVPTLMPLTYLITPPPPAAGQPAIVQIALSDQIVRSGAPYLVIVTTSADVTGVTAEAYGVRFTLFPAGPGRFGVTGTVPPIPWLIANRAVAVRFVATTPDGRSYTTSLELRVGR